MVEGTLYPIDCLFCLCIKSFLYTDLFGVRVGMDFFLVCKKKNCEYIFSKCLRHITQKFVDTRLLRRVGDAGLCGKGRTATGGGYHNS